MTDEPWIVLTKNDIDTASVNHDRLFNITTRYDKYKAALLHGGYAVLTGQCEEARIWQPSTWKRPIVICREELLMRVSARSQPRSADKAI